MNAKHPIQNTATEYAVVGIGLYRKQGPFSRELRE